MTNDVSPPLHGGIKGGRLSAKYPRLSPDTGQRSVTFTGREGCIRVKRVNRDSFSPAIDTVCNGSAIAGEKVAKGRMRGEHSGIAQLPESTSVITSANDTRKPSRVFPSPRPSPPRLPCIANNDPQWGRGSELIKCFLLPRNRHCLQRQSHRGGEGGQRPDEGQTRRHRMQTLFC